MRRIEKRVNLWQEGEYAYPMAFGFEPNLRTYLHRDKARKAVLIVPGGAYQLVSPFEGEIVAEYFYQLGYQALVLTYTTNLLLNSPLWRQPAKDLARAIRLVRKNAKDWLVEEDKVILCGFSAGGHLCADLCVHFADLEDENPDYQAFSNRPSAAILAYPVISSGQYRHEGTFQALLGQDLSQVSREDMAYYSLEKQVSDQTPPCFLWHTGEDQAVPVENSYLFAMACRDRQVPFAHHVFAKGAHGLGLANSDWFDRVYDNLYPLDQFFALKQAMEEGKVKVSPARKIWINNFFAFRGETLVNQSIKERPYEVSRWLALAHDWIKAL